jgi:hypothetical protein
MSTGTAVGVLIGGLVMLGLGIFAIVMAGRAMGSSATPDVSVGGAQVGKSGLIVFIVLGIVFAIVGLVLGIDGIRGLAG